MFHNFLKVNFFQIRIYNRYFINYNYVSLDIIKSVFICRDSLLASLLDGVRASGNTNVHISMCPVRRGYRFGPLHLPVEEEAESLCVKFLLHPPPRHSFSEMVHRFNANVPYSGLLYSVTQDVSILVYFIL